MPGFKRENGARSILSSKDGIEQPPSPHTNTKMMLCASVLLLAAAQVFGEEAGVEWMWWPPLPHAPRRFRGQGERHGWVQRSYLMDNFILSGPLASEPLRFGCSEEPFPGLETVNQSPTAYGGECVCVAFARQATT